MLWRSVRDGCLFIGLLLIAGLTVVAQVQVTAITLVNRQVTEVISEYEGMGYEFLYSTGVVRPSHKFKIEPPIGDPIQRLQLALENLGLTLRQNPNGVWLIVRVPTSPREQILQGRVLDEQTREPLEGVLIEIANQVLTTDARGYFKLILQEPGPVFVSHTGYENKRIYGEPDVLTLLEIPLVPEPPMDEIIVVSSRYAVQSSRTRSHLVDLELLDSIPSLGEDPLRITSRLPGMATIGVSAKPHIRGGSQDELLVLFNNLELLEPFHLRDFQSVFSSFNPSLIQSIDVYTGGFPARYGDRMSGVMDINPTDDHRSTRGEVALSFLNAGVLLHGESREGRGHWVVSGRRGNLDIVTRQINSTLGEPSYNDWFGQFRFELDALTELDLGLIAYNDDIELSDFDTDGEIAESRYRNVYGWVQLHRVWSPHLDGTTLLYLGSIRHDRQGFLFDEDLDNGEATVDDQREFRLWSISQTFNYELSAKAYAEFGGRYTYQSARYDYVANIERGELADFLGTSLTETRAFNLRPRGGSGGLFASMRLEPWRDLLIEAGLRWDFQDYGQGLTEQVSPRLSVKFDVGESTELRFSAGRFFQPEGIHELQVGDGVTRYQDVQYADHYILGWHQQFGQSGFSLRTELFAKYFSDPKRRFENLFNPLVLLPELASDRIEIRPQRARARGFETTLQYQPDEQLMAWLTYTSSKVEDRIGRQWQPRSWDQGNTLSSGLSWEMGAWTIAGTLIWHDGWRTTRLPAQVAENEEPEIRRNRSRLRDYISMDLQISHKWQWERQSLTAFLEVTNVLSRRNVGGIEYDIEEDEDAGVFLLTSENEELLPLVPSIGVRWQF